ncbi:asparagine--tRNA ligase [Euryarchaeota archaeon]|nr:asparagine--tRNA ligase [Euryarchaeota archaeon]
MVKEIWIDDILSGQYDDQEVELKGWIHRSRGSNKIRFIVIRDSTGHIQCVAKREPLGDEFFDELKGSLIESSVILKGIVKSTDREHGHEVQITSGVIVGSVNPERPFPITESAMAEADGGETEFLLDNRHLYLRTSRMTTMLKLRSSVFGAVHSYFRNRDFIEYQAPNFVSGAVEGGSTLFEVPYFGRKDVYLTQSWQLYAEAAMPALERLYTMAPSFRAEKSRTRRHLTEFWHAEMEIAWATNNEVMKHGEGVVRHIASTLLDERSDELLSLGRDLELVSRYADNPYPIMRYDEAIEILQSKDVDVEWGEDLDFTKEKILTADFEAPHFLTHYPKIAKPFYHRQDPDDPKYVLCHDLLAPEGYGEIIGGGERTWSEKEILERLDEEETPKEPYEFYIDTRRYGGVPHGGFGLGVDRVCTWLSGADHIREVIPFPRDSRRVTP